MHGKCGLYIHIPFCSRKCLYCDFYSKSDLKEIDTYVCHMVKAIKYYGSKYKNKLFDTVYIGGGTPSVIGTDNLAVIISSTKENFNIEATAEITIEMNPKSALKIDFGRLCRLGVNRISLGVQSSNEKELELLGRVHSNTDVISAVNMIKSGGIENISLDLMVGISRQTEQSLKSSMDFCISLEPKHISAYILKVEDNTPYKNLALSLNLPNDDKQAQLYEFMQSYLTAGGYEQYEISNFAKKGYESRHNIKYWNCDEYLGLGASAHSMMDKKRFYFPRSNEDFYRNKIIDEGEGASSDEYIMLRLRLKDGLYYKDYERLFNSPLPQGCINTAKKYEKYGLTSVLSNKIALTPKGFLLSNSIIAEMLAKK